MVLLVGHLPLTGLAPAVVGQLEALLHALAAVARHLLAGRQLVELLDPLVAGAARGQAAAQPAQAVLLECHQHRLCADVHLVGGHLLGPGAGELVEHSQRRRGLAAGLLGPPPQAGHGRGGRAEEDRQQGAGGGQADALGLGRGGEPGLPVGPPGDGPRQLLAQAVGLGPGLGELAAQLGQGPREAVGVEVAGDGLGLAVQPLPRGAAAAGQAGDVAVTAPEDGVGAGDAVGGG